MKLSSQITSKNWAPMEAEFIRLKYHTKHHTAEEKKRMDDLEISLGKAYAQGIGPTKRYYDVENVPVMRQSNESGDIVIRAYDADAPRPFPEFSLWKEGMPISEEQFDDMIRVAKAETELHQFRDKREQSEIKTKKSPVDTCQKIIDSYSKKQVSGYYERFLVPGDCFRMHQELAHWKEQSPKTPNMKYYIKMLESALRAIRF